MTAHADCGSDFKTQHVLERNHNIDFGLAFWPKQIRMNSFLVQKPNYGAAFVYALCGGEPISSQIIYF
jgi:hypothetical protein